MAADEYYDAIGKVLSYILSAEDHIVGQKAIQEGTCFLINKNNTDLILYAVPDKRYFTITYKFSITAQLKSAYGEENQILREHMEEFDVDGTTVGDENLDDIVAFQRLKRVDPDEAWRILENLLATDIHTSCRFKDSYKQAPSGIEDDETLWDGVEVIGLLYPYEDTFSPRDYEEVAQEVISVGSQVDTQMEKLNVMSEIGFESVSNII